MPTRANSGLAISIVLLAVVGPAALGGCRTQANARDSVSDVSTEAPKDSMDDAPDDVPKGEPARVTPELAAKAEQLLDAHGDEPVGTELPFSLRGTDYVGRIEMHEDAEKGPHKGVTVYVAE